MKALKVVTLVRKKLSLKSLQSLINLVTLQLIDCELRDISSLKKLAKLEILSLQHSVFDESLEELKELNKLRMLDLRCYYLERIPVDVIPRLSRLEQLYITSTSSESWEVEGTYTERSNASLFDLNKYCLTILSLRIIVHQRLPKDFILLKKLIKYDIRVNYEDLSESHPTSRSIAIKDIEGTSLFAFKPLYENVEDLQLYNIRGCCPNIVPSIDETGLNELKKLSLQLLQEVECIIDMTQQHVPSTTFSDLVDLFLDSVDLREICNGGRPPRGFLRNLETLRVNFCNRISCLFPTLLIQRLGKLKKMNICRCHELQDVFQLEGICQTKENPFLLSGLASLDLSTLPNLRYIWNGPTQQVSLQSLTIIELAKCEKLRYIFTLNLARSMLQLQQLKVKYCHSLEHIVEIKAEEIKDNVVARDGNDVMLPKLRILQLKGLQNLINFCSKNYSSTWPALQELGLELTPSLVAELGANLQTAKETLRVLRVHNSGELCKTVLPQLQNNFENLEELKIGYCRVHVIFQLEQQFSLSSLKQLESYLLPELECLYKGPAHLLSLPNLQKLVVRTCPRLRHLLSSTLARNLLQLKTIHIWLCGDLEQLMVEDDREDHVQLPLFPNLSSIDVDTCRKLKALFPVRIARSDLQQLTSLHVTSSPQLEEIFGHKDETDMTGDTELELVLPQLKDLTLKGLESLVNFCPSGYHLIFPSLSSLWVSKCPKITTIFSVDENGSVHAHAKAPHSHNQHAVDIKCLSSDDVRRTLPPYIGK